MSTDDPAKSQVSYVPLTKAWTKVEFGAIAKEFPKVTEDHNWFADEFNMVIQAYQFGFPNLYQLLHTLVDEGQAQHWMAKANWIPSELDKCPNTGNKLPI